MPLLLVKIISVAATHFQTLEALFAGMLHFPLAASGGVNID